MLYLIEILHQTTTKPPVPLSVDWLYLIEILHQTTTAGHMFVNANSLYLIEILHQTTTRPRIGSRCKCCILSKFYIKPQPGAKIERVFRVVSYRNSTSNHNTREQQDELEKVVSYRNSTSNHNFETLHLDDLALYLIEILHQTTTFGIVPKRSEPLYLIEILHQTTTFRRSSPQRRQLYLIEILHQTTTIIRDDLWYWRCILSKFYIKPQRRASY